MSENEITYKIIGAAYKVYNALGAGLLESVYEEAMVYQLTLDGLKCARQQTIPVIYNGYQLKTELRLDILVEDEIIVELKSVENLNDIHFKQIDTYLKLSGKHLGLLINFNTTNIKKSIHRRINGYS